MNKRQFKDKVYTELARMTKSMANSHRLEIIELLAQGEFSVEQIGEQTNLTIANASQHLQVLKQAHVVASNRKGNFIFYRLANDHVFQVWKALRELGVERIESIEKVVKEFRKPRFDFETITIDDLIEKMKTGNITILDVRPESEYEQGHIAHSISIPIENLPTRLNKLSRRSEIVAYCRGPFCVYADEAVSFLIKSGYNASRLQEGFPDWKVRGLPIEHSLN